MEVKTQCDFLSSKMTFVRLAAICLLITYLPTIAFAAVCSGNHQPGDQTYDNGTGTRAAGYYRVCRVCKTVTEYIPYLKESGTFAANGKTWKFRPTADNTAVCICGVTTAGGDLIFPSLCRGLPVVEIKDFFNRYEHYDSAVIPEGVVEIGPNSFYATALKTVSLPSTLKTIGDYAFYGTRLTDVEIPASVEKIGEGIFASSDITDVVIAAENKYYFADRGSIYQRDPLVLVSGRMQGECYVLDGTVELAADMAFYSKFTSLSIPGSVKTIHPLAIEAPRYLSLIEFRNGVISCSLGALNQGYHLASFDNNQMYYPPAIKICRSVTDITSDMSILKHIKYVFYEEGDQERVRAMVERAGLNLTDVAFMTESPKPLPQEWVDGIPGFSPRYCRDAALASQLPTGKVGADGREMTVFDDYVAGTDPMDVTSRFVSGIELVDGRPIVFYEPDLGEARRYTIYGSDDLKSWVPTEGDITPFKFFKVAVDLPE